MAYKLHIVHLLIVFSFLFIPNLCFPLYAQSVEPEFEHIPIALSFCYLQDSNGFLWVGSQEGLARYDGYNLKYYTNIPFDSTSISNNWVPVIKEDKNEYPIHLVSEFQWHFVLRPHVL